MSIQMPPRGESIGNADLSIRVSLVRLSLNWIEILHSIPANSLYSTSQIPSNWHLDFPCIMPIRHCWNEICELDCVCLFVTDLILMPTKKNLFLVLQKWEQDHEWSWRYQGKCHLMAHTRALDKQPAGPLQDSTPLFPGHVFCFSLFCFVFIWNYMSDKYMRQQNKMKWKRPMRKNLGRLSFPRISSKPFLSSPDFPLPLFLSL